MERMGAWESKSSELERKRRNSSLSLFRVFFFAFTFELETGEPSHMQGRGVWVGG